MKKNLTKLMALIMALALMFAFAACGKKTDDTTTTTTEAVGESDSAAPDNTETSPVDPTGGSEGDTQTDPVAPTGPIALVKPADAAAAVKMYNDAVGKIASTKGTYSRTLDEGQASKGFIKIDIKTADVEKEFNLNNVELPNAKLSTLDAGLVSSMTAKEEGNSIVIDFALKDFSGNKDSKHGNGGFMYFIDIDEATQLVGKIGGVFGITIEVFPDEATLALSGGKLSVTIDKGTGKLTKASLSFSETLDAKVKAPLQENIVVKADAHVKGHGTANYVLG